MSGTLYQTTPLTCSASTTGSASELLSPFVTKLKLPSLMEFTAMTRWEMTAGSPDRIW